jgi:alkanesulfonate monooxygenase SsuD/methylene tetrahydromethanopterin reductase-like flavin-dependent oxidoreductase (luciferase family)
LSQNLNITLGALLESSWPASKDRELARFVEEHGYDEIWVNGNIQGRDPFSILSILSLETQRLKLGTSVVNPSTRHPLTLASSIATLDEISNGRAMLGFGSSYAEALNLIGMEGEKPVEKCREAIEIIRSLLNGNAGEFTGSQYKLVGAKLSFKSRPDIKILLGLGTGPNMAKLAGQSCDGAIFHELAEDLLGNVIANVQGNLSKRHVEGFRMLLNTMVSVGSTREQGIDAIRQQMGIFLTPRLGRTSTLYHLSDEDAREYIKDYRKIPDEFMRKFAICGSVDDCLERLEELRAMGITGIVHRYPSIEGINNVQNLLMPRLKRN